MTAAILHQSIFFLLVHIILGENQSFVALSVAATVGRSQGMGNDPLLQRYLLSFSIPFLYHINILLDGLLNIFVSRNPDHDL